MAFMLSKQIGKWSFVLDLARILRSESDDLGQDWENEEKDYLALMTLLSTICSFGKK